MKTREELSKENPNMLFADGFDGALIGTTLRPRFNNPKESVKVALYSTDKCIEILAKDMSHEDATEYFYFNVEGSYMGPNTPVFS